MSTFMRHVHSARPEVPAERASNGRRQGSVIVFPPFEGRMRGRLRTSRRDMSKNEISEGETP